MNDSDILYSQCFLFSCSCFHNWSGSSFSSHCWVKEFETPKASQQYSACCRDFKEYISTCPEYADNWKSNRKCRDEPASLVWRGAIVWTSNWDKYILTWYYQVHTIFHIQPGNMRMILSISKSNFFENKFKNSYCAACSSTPRLGCSILNQSTS